MLGEKLLIKLWDSIVDKGIGGLLTPGQILREEGARTEARRREMLLLAKAKKESEDILKGHSCLLVEGKKLKTISDKKSSMPERIEPTFTLEHILETTTNSERSRKIREEVNVNKAVIYAEEELINDPQEPPEADIDDDWLYKWKDSASKVSEEKLQQLWGKVLAGETKAPGKFSLRTLDFLKSISQKEAQLIEKIAIFNISDCIGRDETTFLEENGISFSKLIHLQELGILTGIESIGIKVDFANDIDTSFQKVLISNNKALLVTNEDKNKKLSFNIYGLSTIGKEVLSLGNFEANTEYLTSIGEKFVELGFTVEIGDWVSLSKEGGNLTNRVCLNSN